MRRVFVATLALTLINYLAMLLWTLPALIEAAGGLRPFDLRPLGYDLSQTRGYLGALPGQARDLYLTAQHWLDTTYPALLALSLILALHLLLGARGVWLARAGSVVAVLGAVADYVENAAVAALLRAGAEGVTQGMVAWASAWTVAKSAATGAVMTVALAAAIAALWHRWKRSMK
ncbi:MAG: hypothetical protein RI566_01620 [Sediminimonas sp.]|uniref:hypothetical protein n=1 Tax=Sediminimonas sp. TaxID=2823379 RepID=UPI002870376F|nr:hypothetical protein [Sediminimonas sp.]MDR9483847.1 hypothetical protein [Sediminimonas sp.]